MCGFAGMVSRYGTHAQSTTVRAMLAAIRHRGPDGEGIYASGPVCLGLTRLSILDLSDAGNQPMVSPDGQVVLVFNGEIYNYLELRSELQALGHSLHSSGDTEVLLHAYLAWDLECLSKLNGMWSFVIYDLRKQKIIGSRDRFGKKPFFYYRTMDSMFFASEIKSILASGHYKGGTNWEKAAEVLLSEGLETLPEDGRTFYSEIHQLPAGSIFEMDMNLKSRQRLFWSLESLMDSTSKPPTAVEDAAEHFYELLRDACAIRMRSDVPVGILLSGGIDSASILCCLAEGVEEQLFRDCPAISYQPTEYDESAQLNQLIDQTGVRVVLRRPEDFELWNSLEQMLWFQDEPVHSMAAVIEFELYRTASREGIKVVLNGGGLDEYLAGYPNFFRNYWCSLLKSGRVREAQREITAYCAIRGGDSSELLRSSWRHLVRSQLHRFPGYSQLARWSRLREMRDDPWYTLDLGRRLTRDTLGYIGPTLDSELKRSMTHSPLPLYLRIDDRNSMAHSVEARLPFLDYRLVSFAFQLPANWKMRGPWSKYLLRQATAGRVPDIVRTRVEKWGFPSPTQDWFAGQLSSQIEDLLGSRQVKERGIYNLGRIRDDYKLYCEGKIDITGKIFNLVQFELWSALHRPNPTVSETGMATVS